MDGCIQSDSGGRYSIRHTVTMRDLKESFEIGELVMIPHLILVRPYSEFQSAR